MVAAEFEFAYAAPHKVHSVVLGAVKRVPYSKAGDPAGAAASAPSEESLKIRALLVDGVLKEWTTGEAHDVTDRSFAVRRAIRINDALPGDKPGPAQAKPLGVAARTMAAGGPYNRPCDRAEAARLRPGREPGDLVSRLRGLLRSNGNRQELVCGGGTSGGAQTGAGQKACGI